MKSTVFVFALALAGSAAGCIYEEAGPEPAKKTTHGTTISNGGAGGSGNGEGGGAPTTTTTTTSTTSTNTTTTSAGGAGPALPDYVQIAIVDAQIWPATANGECWDGFCTVSQDDLNKVAEALVQTGNVWADAAAVGAVLAGLANGQYDLPDPIGTAWIWNNGNYDIPTVLADDVSSQQDTLTPSWPGSPGWTNVPLAKNLAVKIHIDDADLSNNDTIGDVKLNYNDVVAALLSKKVYPVRVQDQGSHLILFVGIDVQSL